ncbi:cyclic nucleotide-gated ion channel-like isoform 4-T10 [Cochliomyia hominivorax]
MKLSVSAYRAHASAHKKILSSGYHSQLNYGSTGAAATASSSTSAGLYAIETNESSITFPQEMSKPECNNSDTDVISPTGTSSSGQDQIHPISKRRSQRKDDDQISNAHSSHSDSKSPSQRKSRIGDGTSDPDSDWTRSNQRWMKLRTTVQISSAIQKKPPLKREDSFLKRFSTRQIPEAQETVEDTGSESASGDVDKTIKRRRRYLQKRRSVVNPDENFYFYWLMVLTICVLYNLWTLIVRQSFPELQKAVPTFWFICDTLTDIVFIFDIFVQLRTGYLEQGLMVYDDKKLMSHYVHSRDCFLDFVSLVPFDLLQLKMGSQPLLRFTRFFKVYRSVRFYYIVESRTVWPNLWRVVNLIHILLILAHWFGCFYYLLSEAEGFQGDWVYPYRPGDYATLTRKYLGSLYWSTLTLTTIGDLPTPETNAEYIFTIVSYLIGVFIFATIVGQVGNVITNRNANRLEFERLLDGAKTYMRHHKVPGGMKRRVLRWYDYSWSRGRIQGGGDINTALGLLPDKLKTELALHVNLSVLKKVTIFQECQPEFLHDLVLKMKAYIFTPGDSICRKGEVAREMFIIADGILEVLSETGKVLTTMKAGDFFGEIGILNLDGLNKRTADVRSVGYSELFSLSREDVLAAMKDYPEAQEILQTLGRKRLMEVRCVNKKYAKAQADKDAENHQGSHHHHSHVNQSDSSENSASKKIVDKLRHDVKGFRSVLKKSRTTRKSDESLEMQPLHSTSPKNGKSMLKRMSRVRSDEKEETAEEKEELHDKSPSPIGAGLPLLQRLRLLKEKQDREERAVKSTPPQKSPPHSHVTCTLSPQESIQEEPEREINEGLPLIQRLQQLKIKNDPPHPVNDSSLPTSSVTSEIINKLENISNISSNNSNNTPISLTNAQNKAGIKVSFRQRIQQLQLQATDSEASCSAKTISKAKDTGSEKTQAAVAAAAATLNVKKEPPKTLSVVKCGQTDVEAGVDCKTEGSKNKSHKPISNNSSQVVKPSTVTPTVVSDIDTPIKPWSKLKLATLISSSYTSLATSNTSSDDVTSPPKIFSLGSIPQQVISEEKHTKNDKAGISTGKKSSTEQTSLSSSSTKQRVTEKSKKSLKNGKALQSAIANQTKLYQSVFDLSPEYSGLPFVKRLKILNERQKLVELEKALQTRSFSLDSSKTSSAQISEALYRCHSDATGINSQFFSAYESSSTTSTNTSTSEKSKCPHHHRHHRLDTVNHEYAPLSPESNETLERRKLKSILKKFSHEREHRGMTDEIQIHCRGLSMEPTVEGPPGSIVITNPDNTKDEHQSDNSLKSPITSDAPPYYAESVMSPPDLLRAESITTCCTTANCTHNFQMNKNNSSTLTMFPTDLYPHSGTSNGTCHITTTKGLHEDQDCYSQIVNGINNVIRTHINEIHSKFESQFSSMAMEVEKRDALIAQLQSKLRTLEMNVSSSSSRRKTNRDKMPSHCSDGGIVEDLNADDNSSSGSSAELLFMRGDSLDTVFTSSPPTLTKRHCTCSPKSSRDDFGVSNYSHYCKTGNGTKSQNGNNWTTNQTIALANVQGNLSRIGDSVILDIGESTSSSSSSEKLNIDDEDDDDEIESSDNHVHHNDWEVRMLAAEMEKQERKRGHSLSDNLQVDGTKLCGTFLRRRRKFSDTETEHSETDAEHAPSTVRPRASSLDQFNLRYGISRGGIFKAMSIDRDKDKL